MKKINIIDVVIFAAITLALVVGYYTYKHYRETAGDRIQTTAKIGFQVFLRGVTLTGNDSPVNPGDKTFITIRNVPYTELQILDVKIQPKKTIVANSTPGKEPVVVNDVSQFGMFDIIVALVDTGKITKDGAVIGGNKIKIGLPITLEGPSYKLNGTVSDVRMLVDNNPQGEAKPGPVEVAPQGGTAQAPAPAQGQAPAPVAPQQPQKASAPQPKN